MQAHSLSERIGARRATVNERVEKAAEVTTGEDAFVWWCNLNAEAELAAKKAAEKAAKIDEKVDEELSEQKAKGKRQLAPT